MKRRVERPIWFSSVAILSRVGTQEVPWAHRGEYVARSLIDQKPNRRVAQPEHKLSDIPARKGMAEAYSAIPPGVSLPGLEDVAEANCDVGRLPAAHGSGRGDEKLLLHALVSFGAAISNLRLGG